MNSPIQTDTTRGEAQVDLKPWHTCPHTHSKAPISGKTYPHSFHSLGTEGNNPIGMGQRCHGDEDLEWRSSSIRISLHGRPYNTCWSVSIKYAFIPATQGYFFQGRLIVVTLFAKVNISQVMFMFESRGTYYKKTNKDIEHFCCYCPGENCGACCHNRTDIKQPIAGFIAKLKHDNYCTTII